MSYQLYRNTTLGQQRFCDVLIPSITSFVRSVSWQLIQKAIQTLLYTKSTWCTYILTIFFCFQLMVFPNLPGHTLQESLDELMQLQMLSPALALRYFKPCQQKTHTMQGLQYIPFSLTTLQCSLFSQCGFQKLYKSRRMNCNVAEC